ncbi:MAG: hypothetical protein KDB27_05010 [Planctomycetales bacterium]|nr:hypothetical protein [Planctomycetales bacterium]
MKWQFVQSLAITCCISSTLFAQTLEFRYEFDSTEDASVDSTGQRANLTLLTNGEEHRLGEPSLVGGDGYSTGLNAPGDGHPTGSFILVPDAPQPESFSVSLWMKPIFTGTTEAIFARDDRWWPSPCNFYCLYIDEAQSLVWKTGGMETILTDEGIIEEDEIHHVVVTYSDTDGPDTGSADVTRVYVNGELVGEEDNPQEIPSLDALQDANNIYELFWLGTLSSFGGYRGELDDLQFYNGELTAAQVTELYSNPGTAIGGGGNGPDFDGDGTLDIDDINMLTEETASGANTASFDLTGDSIVNQSDIAAWLDERNTWVGDSNLDGEFNSTDFVVVFTANEYEDAVDGNSNWSEGDWNGDGDFDSSDFVAAFTAGGYEKGVRPAAVPEPTACVLGLIGLFGLMQLRRQP